jgi:hypothetical protein
MSDIKMRPAILVELLDVRMVFRTEDWTGFLCTEDSFTWESIALQIPGEQITSLVQTMTGHPSEFREEYLEILRPDAESCEVSTLSARVDGSVLNLRYRAKPDSIERTITYSGSFAVWWQEDSK